ncbi:MAG: type III-B CRISPR module-associated Cmr3 family protein [Verrucomicrobiota bacterium]|jgi:hypothetical protein
MNTILLNPTDVLFFRDGRPMEGSLAGHGAAWPLPNVIDAAFHAALHRSGLATLSHAHDQRRGTERHGTDNRRFGSLVTAGPFPVRFADDEGKPLAVPKWFFPRPLDLLDGTLRPALAPTTAFGAAHSSLPDPLKYAVANRLAPSKVNPAKAWLSGDRYHEYLHQESPGILDHQIPGSDVHDDDEFSDAEATIGIGLDAETGTTGQGDAEGQIYSARYLRLRDAWRLGVFARTSEKSQTSDSRVDLIESLLNGPQQLLVGGQQRLCTAKRVQGNALPLPMGRTKCFAQHQGNCLVKWILLSPAIWPEIPEVSKDGRTMTPHCGGWLPNWVHQESGRVLLRAGKRMDRRYSGKHARGYAQDAVVIGANLVAAIVPKPIPVTGWALANDVDRAEGGAKSVHFAVPAGAVYYFEADSEEQAAHLAAALNWHGGDSNPQTIHNRRSTLMGEKGFGLGVCGTWRLFGK